MIEPTETESKETLDEFVDIMLRIVAGDRGRSGDGAQRAPQHAGAPAGRGPVRLASPTCAGARRWKAPPGSKALPRPRGPGGPGGFTRPLPHCFVAPRPAALSVLADAAPCGRQALPARRCCAAVARESYSRVCRSRVWSDHRTTLPACGLPGANGGNGGCDGVSAAQALRPTFERLVQWPDQFSHTPKSGPTTGPGARTFRLHGESVKTGSGTAFANGRPQRRRCKSAVQWPDHSVVVRNADVCTRRRLSRVQQGPAF